MSFIGVLLLVFGLIALLGACLLFVLSIDPIAAQRRSPKRLAKAACSIALFVAGFILITAGNDRQQQSEQDKLATISQLVFAAEREVHSRVGVFTGSIADLESVSPALEREIAASEDLEILVSTSVLDGSANAVIVLDGESQQTVITPDPSEAPAIPPVG